ncbi:MAG: tyrosine-type recombinase/integrase [Planctomycetota bacterium]
MKVSRRKYKDGDGKLCTSRFYSVRFVDHRGAKRSLKLFEAKGASEQFAARLRRLVDAQTGGEPLDRDMMAWLSRMRRDQLERLIEIGLVEQRRISSTLPIEDHLEAWQRSVAAKGRTRRHIDGAFKRASAVLAAVGARRWADIDSHEIETWLAEQTGAEGWSISTHNRYAQSVKQFCRWMVDHEHAIVDPLRSLKLRSAGTGTARRKRRALTLDECRALIQAAESSTVAIHGVLPATRGLLYRTALRTGLRFGELTGLRVGWIDFGRVVVDPRTGVEAYEGKPTTITPPAEATKAGRKTGRVDTIVIPVKLHHRLAAAARGRHPNALLFDRDRLQKRSSARIPEGTGSRLIKLDLAAAGIPYVDPAGRYADFHALRHTALTLFGSAGASMDEMLSLARHSDPNVTRGYLHSELASRAAVVERLPDLDSDDDSAAQRSAVGAEFCASENAHPVPESAGAVRARFGSADAQMGGKCGPPYDFESAASTNSATPARGRRV